MVRKISDHLASLRQSGWIIEYQSPPEKLPVEITSRYPWIPPEYRQLAEQTVRARTADETTWLLTGADYGGTSDSAYVWNEAEVQSLDAAGSDAAWKEQIIAFWNDHFPILFSVKSGYATFAIEKGTLAIVYGEEPEYEETTRIAPSLAEFLSLLARRDGPLGRFL